MFSLWDQSASELFTKGGPIMWPLAGCSVVAGALVLDRAWALLVRRRLDFAAYRESLRTALARDRRPPRGAPRHPAVRVATAYVEHLDSPDETRAGIVDREGALAIESAEARLRGLAAIAQVSTLLGLLGTVAGLVSAFHRIELGGGRVRPEELAGGIWAALLTTVYGLSIAIPSFLAVQYFEGRVDAMARQASYVVSYLDEWLGRATPVTSPRASGEAALARTAREAE